MPERDYTITGQRQDRAIINGRAIDVVEVDWAGPNEIAGSVVIPASQFGAARVDQAIRDDLAKHLEVAQLGQANQGA